jgi:hypothetical protein
VSKEIETPFYIRIVESLKISDAFWKRQHVSPKPGEIKLFDYFKGVYNDMVREDNILNPNIYCINKCIHTADRIFLVGSTHEHIDETLELISKEKARLGKTFNVNSSTMITVSVLFFIIEKEKNEYHKGESLWTKILERIYDVNWMVGTDAMDFLCIPKIQK